LFAAVLSKLGLPVISVALAVIVGSAIMLAAGFDPLKAFGALLNASFGSPRAIGETLLRTTPLLFTGLAVAYGFRAGLFNIGAEGQLFMGGLTAAYLGVALGSLPPGVLVPVIIVVGMLVGAAWAFIPAILKARIGAHEVITTMMFTFIARHFVSYLTSGPLKAPGPVAKTVAISETARLPLLRDIFGFLPEQLTRVHVGFLIGVGIAIVVWFILKYTTLGYENRAVGFNPTASETAGISVSATTVKALCISGALAALAGVTQVMGLEHALFDQFSAGFGFTGIAVALLAKNHPIGVIPAAVLFGALSAGAGRMQLEAKVPLDMVFIIQALVIFFVAAEEISRWFVRRSRGEVTEGAQ
jgi:simple sugar transport system permease protein